MRTLSSLLMLTLIGAVSSLAAQDNSPAPTPPRVKEAYDAEFERYPGYDGPPELNFPLEMNPWPITRAQFPDKDDKRNDFWMLGARPTLLVVTSWYALAGIGDRNGDQSDEVETLTNLLEELEDHADDHEKEYDVVLYMDVLGTNDREEAWKVVESVRLKHLGVVSTEWSNYGVADGFSDYWSNIIHKPDARMVSETEEEHWADASWVWMPKPGTMAAWGIWGYESEDKRLEEFADVDAWHEAYELRSRSHKKILTALGRWQFGDASRLLKKLEDEDNEKSLEAARVLRDYEDKLVNAYRQKFCSALWEDGYYVEWLERMNRLAEDFYDKRNERSKVLRDELEEFEKSDTYKHAEKAKEHCDRLADDIQKDIPQDVHNEAWQKEVERLQKKYGRAMQKAYEDYGDTPYVKRLDWLSGRKSAGK